jgi:probable rRNA maturation factor
MSGNVLVASRRRRRGVRAAQVKRDAEHLLRQLELDAELSVALVGDEEMRELNAQYRKIDKATDVLSFALEDDTPTAGQPRMLGDVVISLDTAARQAEQRDTDLLDEVRTLLVHGLLHLLGYDHERSAAEARRMFARQRKLVAALPASPNCKFHRADFKASKRSAGAGRRRFRASP